MFDIVLGKQPTDFLKKCDKTTYERVMEKLLVLRSNPVPGDVKRVVGYNLPTFRLRTGKYRTPYRINYPANTIFVVTIDLRDRVYE